MEAERRRGRAGGERRLSRLDTHSHTAGYFHRVRDTLEQGFEQEEEKGLFITNVMREVQGQEFELCTNASVSKVLERFLAECGAPELRRFLAALQPHWAQLSCHCCGAHVVQAALLQVTRLGGQLQLVEEEGTGGENRSLETLICQMSSGIRENFLEHAGDTHGTFVVRTLMQVLGGVVLTAENAKKISHKKTPERKRDVQPAKVMKFDVPDRFLEELREFARLLEANVKVFLTNPIASPVFKIAVQVLERREHTLGRGLCVAVIEYLRSPEQVDGCSPLLMFLKDKTGSRLLESIILASDKKLFTKLYKSHFKGQLVSLALHPIANYTVQRFLAAAPSQKLFSKLFDELCPALEDILAQGHTGIITELVAACVKHRDKQLDILTALYQAFHCCEPFSRRMACASLFLSLSTYQIVYGLSEEDVTTEHQPPEEQCLKAVSYHGSLLTQHLLHFDNPVSVTSSLVSMPCGDLVRLACDQAGSHVFDALFTSSSVSDKQRRKVIRKLKGQFVQLACDRHGSRVLDQIWVSVSLKMKQMIAEELASRETELQSDPFGHHIARNLALTHFLKRRGDWDQHQAADSKRRKVFAELLED